MRRLAKYIVARTYKPLLVQYLSKTRRYRYGDIVLQVPTEVFHPGFFYSTQLLLKFISSKQLKGASVLELGAGSGLLSIFAAKKGATVTASDINSVAVNYLEKNAVANGVVLNIIHSDLFRQIPEQSFDLILINPPYYKKDPATEIEHAWYCGENGEYFKKLFESLLHYTSRNSEVLMVLSDGCDVKMIRSFAGENGFDMVLARQKRTLIETNFIFRIEATE